MATPEEKVAAVTKALDALSSTDRQNSVKRFVAMFDAMMALQPAPTQATPEATYLMSFTPSEADRPAVDRLNGEIMALLKKHLAVPQT